MGLQYTAATYADFKTFMADEAFKGEIFYADIPQSMQSSLFQFNVTAVDIGRRIIISLYLQSATTDQKPATFNTDFPSATQLTGLPSIAFVGD
jgi:hypothetical protein